ncbi:glycoside hydrolase family 17 protein [Thelonectria olida]|uniref:Glycoside hydrolase family 17 protein n=1 Tax=Thelonectria olida TaxID=1576542 RepID=A0A9P9AMR5_9HYPO|nr:glycoside hydrolase family 17 protein [Thelonectria olida]
MRVSSTIAAAGLIAGASAKNYLGFNSGATLADRSAKFKADFKAEFETAQNLKNAPGDFNAVRLYTNIQAYSETDPIEAFEAAIETDTSILLGVWTSGTDSIDKEITALKAAVSKFGKSFTDLVIGISIGSEDLYRNSVAGVKNKGGIGADPDVIVGFIKDFKKAFANTALASVPLGHVDTWDVWPNATNKAVLDAVDWVGVDEYPYYESDKGNSIENAGKLFDKAYDATIAAVGGKPVWVTETGWPYTGPDWDEGHPSVANAKKYWQDVGCKRLFNQVPTFWYTLRDSNPDNKMKFAITDNLSTTPRWDLTCPEEDETTTSKSSTHTKTKTSDSESTGTKDADSTETDTKATKPTGSSSGTATGSDSDSTATSTGSSDSDNSGSDSSSGSDSDSASQTSSTSDSASTPSQIVSGASAVKAFSAVGIAAMVAVLAL